MKLFNLFHSQKPIIGMIHLKPLIGYPGYPGRNKVLDLVLADLRALEKGQVSGAIVENEHDHPHQVKPGPETIAEMTYLVSEIVKKAHFPIGVEVLLNYPEASLAIAKITGAKIVRTDYFVDKMTRAEYGGEMEINAQKLMAYRQKIKAEKILILTDLQVKYATLLENGKTIAKSAKQAITAGSDGLIVTGGSSGEPPKTSDLIAAQEVAKGKVGVLIGSGFAPSNAQSLLKHADGAIVGTSIKAKGKVDIKKTKRLMLVVKGDK